MIITPPRLMPRGSYCFNFYFVITVGQSPRAERQSVLFFVIFFGFGGFFGNV